MPVNLYSRPEGSALTNARRTAYEYMNENVYATEYNEI
jgi:hypothetical protein